MKETGLPTTPRPKESGFLGKIKRPAERLAQAAALATSLSVGVETVKPEINNQSVEEKAKLLQDSREIKQKNDDEEDGSEISHEHRERIG
jgi:DNA-binding transcriptional regulator YdaS (Cro superfamily)